MKVSVAGGGGQLIVLHEPVLSLLVVLALGEHLYWRLALLKANMFLALLLAALPGTCTLLVSLLAQLPKPSPKFQLFLL